MVMRPKLTREMAYVAGASAIVGCVVGLVAAGFRFGVDALQHGLGALAAAVGGRAIPSWLVPGLSVAALAVVAYWLVRRFAPEAGGSGVQEVEGALDEVRPLRWKRVLPVKFIGAMMALGGGMALGREGPTVHMGGAVGAMVNKLLRLGSSARHVLIASGAAAGLSAAFNAPLSGVIFIIEEMRPRFHYGFVSFQGVLIASVCADVVTRISLGQQPLIDTSAYAPPSLANLPFFLLYGGLIGGVAVVFSRSLVAVLNRVDAMKPRGRVLAAAIVGLAIGALGSVDSEWVGGGYTAIHLALDLSTPLASLLFLFGIRFVLTLASYGSGVPGGIFAPMLALGTLFGVAFAQSISDFLPGLGLTSGIFAIAGMAAFFSATVRAPLTGIALTIELTGNLDLVLGLLVTCLAATFAAEALGARPLYEMLLERTLAAEDRKKNIPAESPEGPPDIPS
jgi:CIC family chloride channel protein